MRRRIQLKTISKSNDAANVWIQHLVNRTIIEQLDLPHRMKAKLLYETLPISKRRNDNE